MTLREIILHEVSVFHPVGGASFVELEQAFDMVSAEYQGDYWIRQGPIVCWVGWSREAADAFNDALAAGEVHLTPTSPLTYVADGKMLDLPIVKGNYRYKRDHWLPCLVKAGPSPAQRG